MGKLVYEVVLHDRHPADKVNLYFDGLMGVNL
jgi:hypothetical protein